jgi:hypothetical protein
VKIYNEKLVENSYTYFFMFFCLEDTQLSVCIFSAFSGFWEVAMAYSLPNRSLIKPSRKLIIQINLNEIRALQNALKPLIAS